MIYIVLISNNKNCIFIELLTNYFIYDTQILLFYNNVVVFYNN